VRALASSSSSSVAAALGMGIRGLGSERAPMEGGRTQHRAATDLPTLTNTHAQRVLKGGRGAVKKQMGA
jgi:hypothetical protein